MPDNSRFSSKQYASCDVLSERDITDKERLVGEDRLYRPTAHLVAPFGLLNDPNGLVYFNDYYYIFYQWHPNDVVHGLKNWGLYKTKDFVHYEDCGVFLKPHDTLDNFGIYSGGACVLNDQLHLFYTGNHRDITHDYQRKPVQWHVVVDKQDKILSRKVILPYQTEYTEHQRDPYPFISKNGRLCLLLGVQRPSLVGGILLFEFKENVEAILHVQELSLPKDLEGAFMLECPTLATLDQLNVLMVSPQGLTRRDSQRYQNIYSVVYMSSTNLDFTHASVELVDFGFDFYAPQLFRALDRTLMIGWLGQAEGIYPYECEYGWSQVLTLPREISWQEGRLHQSPIDELCSLRGELEPWVDEGWILESRTLDIEIVVEDMFELRIGNDRHAVCIGANDEVYYVDRSAMQVEVNKQYGTYRSALRINKKHHHVRIIIDQSVMEVFFEGGFCVMSLRFFIDDLAYIRGSGVIRGALYPLMGIGIKKLRRSLC